MTDWLVMEDGFTLASETVVCIGILERAEDSPMVLWLIAVPQ